MTLDVAPPARPTAAWISRYAADLLSSTPGLRPLDAVRMAMDASSGTAVDRSPALWQRASAPRGHQR
jgi:hypothetical protein